MRTLLEIVIIVVASSNLLMARFVLFRIKQPTTLFRWLIKVFTSAVAPFLFLLGLTAAVLGYVLDSMPAIIIGECSALLFLVHIVLVTRAPGKSADFKIAFGFDWAKSILFERKTHFLSRRYVIRLPKSAAPIFNQNICFYTIPETNRPLLCDIWQPPKNVKPSGVAFIYLHGSAWTALDKDFGTRPFFKRLAEQGHVIMDVAYRLFPETGFMGMVHDAKHAIAWIKKNAFDYGVNPGAVVIGGGSAGAHIALLAAFTDQDPQFTPEDLRHLDLSVRGVVSLYGQSDLVATYYHTCQHLTKRSALGQQKTGEGGGMPQWIRKKMGENSHRLGFDKNVEPGMLVPILGGNPDEKKGLYSFFSPISHVHLGCPATLIIHGESDILAPVSAIRQLYLGLIKFSVPVVMHILPQTDHAFDLILPKTSPSSHNALYDIERFLAMMAVAPKFSVTEMIEVRQEPAAKDYHYEQA